MTGSLSTGQWIHRKTWFDIGGSLIAHLGIDLTDPLLTFLLILIIAVILPEIFHRFKITHLPHVAVYDYELLPCQFQ